MSTPTANIVLNAGAVEALSSTEIPIVGATNLNLAAFSKKHALNASSTPPLTKMYGERITSSGADTKDLTALTRTLLATLDATGLKLQALILINNSTTNTVTIADGDSNPYAINSAAAIVVPAGGELYMYFNDKLADVDGTHKNIKFTGTSGQTYDLLMCFG